MFCHDQAGGERLEFFRKILYLLFLSVLICFVLKLTEERSSVSGLTHGDMETAAFRSQECSSSILEELEQDQEDFVKNLTISMMTQKYHPAVVHKDDSLLRKYKQREYHAMIRSYESVWMDVEVFPVAASNTTFENTWLSPRTYGGSRLHEGTDIFGEEDIPGYYPVVSMTEGVVEQVGWLPLGGYRLGIRAPRGGYFYYAHLDAYDRAFQPGDKIAAGQLLGYMGNTGYGAEGTEGAFPVHLHLGIYIQTRNYEELSVNPYWVLRYIHKNIIKYSY